MRITTKKPFLILLLVLSLFVFVQASLLVHFVDVGQGDAVLIQTPNQKNILIDGGPRTAGDYLVQYLKEQGVATIDVLIATHPHEDHIGGLINVIDNFPIKEAYYPNKAHTTVTFERFITGINNSKAKRVRAIKGREISVDPDISLVILSPSDRDYKDLNHYSVVTKLVYKNTSFLFTGDAEDINEEEMLAAKLDLQADVLKVGHHGSTTSSMPKFLDAVSPKIAVIMVGNDNKFSHPHKKILDRLLQRDVDILRTDELGDIVLFSDGDELFLVSNTDYEANSFVEFVYITETGKKYHRDGCRFLTTKQKITKDKALDLGYEACGVCKP